MTLGGRSGHHFLTDKIFFDANGNRAYNQGEGVAGIRIAPWLPAADHLDFDDSGTSGAFAVPISSITAGARVEVWLSNPSAATLTIPRDYETHTTFTFAQGSRVLAGTFTKPADTRNIGFRNLVSAEIPAATTLSISRTGHQTGLRCETRSGYR